MLQKAEVPRGLRAGDKRAIVPGARGATDARVGLEGCQWRRVVWHLLHSYPRGSFDGAHCTSRLYDACATQFASGRP
ncbi:hypothetical protein N7510_007459 [Penicillium lagena]|uniref:uncharacterized protein n=1 Tax=Penicillium lagena TaxID=94218 RepID=UPI00253FB26F|nr:uncharacterized protein N7510_007459 [Penicillium lagena]KAJ5610740.1 hypothetical protein N7510_007459 [Penicillium lagena]